MLNSPGGATGPLSLHHVAIATPHPRRLSDYYRTLFQLPEIRSVKTDTRERSVWLQAEGGVILMFESSDESPLRPSSQSLHWKRDGYHMFVFSIEPGSKESWREALSGAGTPVEEESEFTLYFRDPEGNRLGLSHYPHTWDQTR